MGRLRLVVLGMMGRSPFGGQTWTYLHWLLGLAALGHDVWYVEDDIVWFYDPERDAVTDDPAYAVRHVAASMRHVGLQDRWALRFGRDGRCYGTGATELRELYRTCDAVLNVGGATDLDYEHPAMEARTRVYVETDPVVAELRLAAGDERTRALFARHDRFATYGENYGAPDCGVPLDGVRFTPTRQPIALEHWDTEIRAGARNFTTIGNYRQDGYDVEWNGATYRWSKHHEWERFIDLPSRVAQPLEIALVIRDEADRARLRAHGWHPVSPIPFSLDPFGGYREYIQGSRAEFTVAKDQNVRLRSGWFSERDACYLASGKPVVAQDTGFGNVLPTGEGLFAVTNVEEASEAIETINADYERHARAAQAIAREFFDAPRVARRFLEGTGLA